MKGVVLLMPLSLLGPGCLLTDDSGFARPEDLAVELLWLTPVASHWRDVTAEVALQNVANRDVKLPWRFTSWDDYSFHIRSPDGAFVEGLFPYGVARPPAGEVNILRANEERAVPLRFDGFDFYKDGAEFTFGERGPYDVRVYFRAYDLTTEPRILRLS